MSDEITQGLPKWFVDRMRKWADFRVTSGAYGVPSSWPSDGPVRIDGGVKGARYYRLLGSVHDTQVAIDALPARYRRAVVQYWVMEGQGWSMRDHARRAGVTHPTFGAWLRKGNVLLAVDFRRARDRRRAEVDEARSTRARLVDRENLPIYHFAHQG